MFCNKCGSQLDDNLKFCPICGTAIERDNRSDSQPVNNGQQRTPDYGNSRRKPAPKKFAMIGGIAAAAVAAIVIIVVVISGMSTKVDLNKYLRVEVEGYNGYGVAKVTFDENAFFSDYAGKIKVRDNTKIYDALGVDPSYGLYYDVISDSYDVENGENLSNGDTVKVIWNIDQERLTAYKAECNTEPFETEVQDLQEPEAFDPFENITYSVSGVSGDGVFHVEVSGEAPFGVSVDKSENISNGDVVTVTVTPSAYSDDWNKYIKENGKAPKTTTKEVVVEGLAKYLDDASQFTEDMRASMEKNGASIFQNKENTSGWGNLDSSAVEYLGYYVLTAKGQYSDPANRFVFIYKKTDSYTYAGKNASVTYYKAISWDNVVVQEDGSCTVDLTKSECDDARWSSTPERISWVYGYMSVDELYQSEVGTQLENYNCTNYVSAG